MAKKFYYSGSFDKPPLGEFSDGYIIAESVDDARRRLRENGFIAIKITPVYEAKTDPFDPWIVATLGAAVGFVLAMAFCRKK